uniref:Uncharacterized protein n=1 Tax=Bactrocera dorsalis TaxID=27457 RepID=A0A034WHC6_BACDO
MRCFQWCVLLFLITVLHSCVCHPLGIRIASLAKQHESLQDSEFDDYELDDEVVSDSHADDSNDRADGKEHNDDIYEDYDDVNDLADNVKDENDDEEFNDNDDEHHDKVIEENDIEDNSSDDDMGRIAGYRPDVALTSPLEYYN